MASSTTGDRRWASSTKRGGMTVLGKVAVPKPINLPSQRLENHGLDPNVEIVPKGSLSWGARSSSSGSNAWGSSVLSPRTEGGSGSPSHLSGRPSSGGGTRPSTTGSERTPDTTSNLWNANSRPSSASGMLVSNNTSMMSLRPHSAETRPGSSQLSRFAEPSAEGTASWGGSDKMGIATAASDEFSLSSGDFPTLGSEKNSGNNVESIDHNSLGHPNSSSGGPPTGKMDAAAGDVKNGMVNSWSNDGSQSVADGPHPGMERWHGDPHPYPNPNIPPPLYETWRGGAPVNTPGGVWFRGPPGAPYGAPPMAAPGGFPMEPFPYYCPQVSAPGLVNSQAVPPHSAGPRGPHSKNGDLCRPMMEPFMRPGMPIRPGFYPGYYGPPMGFCNPNERDFPFMGVPTGPPVFSRYPNQNASELNNSSARSCEGRAVEQVDRGPPHDPRRYYSVPAKQIVGWDKNIEGDKSNPHDKGYPANSSSQENFWSEDQDHRKDEQMNHGKMPLQSEEASSVLLEDNSGSLERSSVKFYGNKNSEESIDINPVVQNEVLPRDCGLIQKIEGLNAKVRVSDGTQDIRGEETYDRGQLVNSKGSHSINKPNTGIHLERHYPTGILVPVSRDRTVPAEDEGIGSAVRSVTAIPRHSHKLQGRGDHGGRGRFKSQRTSTSESPPDIVTVVQGQEQQLEMQSAVTSRSDGEVKDDSMLSTSDSSDSQRAKMREIAKQRALQLQKEEEERVREQKAKALAKLEELNRRSANQGIETSSRKVDNSPSHADDLQKQEEPSIKFELHFGSIQSGAKVSASHVYIPSKAGKSLESDNPSGVISLEPKHSHQVDPVLSKESLPATDDAHVNDVADSSVQVCEISSQRRAGYKVKNNSHLGKSTTDKPMLDVKGNSSSTVTSLKEVDVRNVPSFSDSKLPVDIPTTADSSAHSRRKNNRPGKNKHKVDESIAVSSATAQKVSDASKSSNESMNLKTLESKPEPLQQPVDSKDAGQSLETHPPSLPHDDARFRGNNPLKPQHARKLPRNSQGRYVEKSHNNDAVVWAPVRSHNETEGVGNIEQKAEEGAIPSTVSDNVFPSSSKSKRAEMERYVPKAAMREPAQQGSTRLSASPSTEHYVPDVLSSKGEATSQIADRAGRPIESSKLESKPKQIQSRGSWHQRGSSSESNFVQVSADKLLSKMDSTKNSQASDVQQNAQPKELPKGSLVKVQPSKQDEWPAKQDPHLIEVNEDNFVDGWNMVDEPVSSVTFAGAKDHGISGRGKRNPFKGHKGSGKPPHFGNKYYRGAEAEADHYSETIQADRPTSSKGKNVAQWQPKSQTHVTNQMGDGTHGNSGSDVKQHTNQDASKSVAMSQISSGPGGKDVSRRSNMGAQDPAIERKASPSKDHAYSPTKDTVIEVHSPPVELTDGTKTEQRPSSSGNRRNGNYNGRFIRGREFHGDRSFTTQENRQNFVPANREKQRHNSRYEYQPVHQNNANRRGNNLEGQIENQHDGPRFRDQHHSTHVRSGGGSFYGRRRGNNQRDASYE